MPDIEKWLPVVGFEGRYEVSDLGRLRGIGPRGRGIRKPYVTKDGYHQYCLYVGLPGQKKTRSATVHSLVAAAFIGRRPDGMMACHNDDIGSHNALSNIRYDTPTGNAADMIKFGNSLPGERNHQAVLTEKSVRAIRRRRGTATYRDIAVDFNVSFSTIQKIMSGEGWRHVG